jgi:8-oxo-dGTP diphosphatase
MMPDTLTSYVIVSGLLRDPAGERVALVQQAFPGHDGAWWGLPGGKVQQGETVHEAAARELAEETGLAIEGALNAGYVVHYFAPTGDNVVVFVFEAVATGTPSHDDPDGDVLDVRLWTISEAIARLEKMPFRVLREPALARLRGHVPPGALWSYGPGADGTATLLTPTDLVDGVTGFVPRGPA